MITSALEITAAFTPSAISATFNDDDKNNSGTEDIIKTCDEVAKEAGEGGIGKHK